MDKCIKLLPLLLICLLISCQENLEMMTLDSLPSSEVEDYEWVAPAELSDNLDENIRILEELSELDLLENREVLKTRTHAKRIVVPAGSKNALQKAVIKVGKGGIVVLARGNHYESKTVKITHRVMVIGRPGAKLHSGVRNTSEKGFLQPAIHIKNADRTVISGIKFIPKIGPNKGGTGILIENSNRVLTALNKMTGFQFGIVLEQANRNRIIGNKIATSTLWQTIQGFEAHGIIVINGDKAIIKRNNIYNSFFNLWACDRGGEIRSNYLHDGWTGLILCNVPSGSVPLPSGKLVGSEEPANHYKVVKNIAKNNLTTGYLVIDGANNNGLTNNKASGNGQYDIELTGDSFRFGFLTPATYDNMVNASGKNLLIKDCGNDNKVIGGVQVDIKEDECF